MLKRLAVLCTAFIGVFLGALALRFHVAAQVGAQAHGIPTPEKIYGDGVTWPIKIDVRDYDMAKLTAPPAISQEAQMGRILWLQKCAYCHDGVGQPTYRTMGPWLGAEVVNKLGEKNVRQFIKNGDVRMPAFQYNLNDQQLDNVIAFLKTVGPDQKPTAAQLAGHGGTMGGD